MRSWAGVWASGVCIGGNVGVCIGSTVMLVVLRWVVIRRLVALSIYICEMEVVCVLVPVRCLVLRQAGIRMVATIIMMVNTRCVLFMVNVVFFSYICTKIMN